MHTLTPHIEVCVYPLVPGSPPYGLSYESVSPNEVNVTWEPPLVPNGVITHYRYISAWILDLYCLMMKRHFKLRLI